MSAFWSFAESGGLEHAFIRGWMALLGAVIIVACGSEPVPHPRAMDGSELSSPCLDSSTLTDMDVQKAWDRLALAHKEQVNESAGGPRCTIVKQNHPFGKGGILLSVPADALRDAWNNIIQEQVDVTLTTWNLETEEVMKVPGLMEGIISPGAPPVGLESLGVGRVEFRPRNGPPVHSARHIGLRGHVPGSIRIGSLLSAESSSTIAPMDNPLFRVPIWKLDDQHKRWVPTGDLARIEKNSKGQYEWVVSLDSLPPVFNVALPFWWRSDLASAEEPLNVPTPAWVETACLAVRVEDSRGVPQAGLPVLARGVSYVGLSRGETDAHGQVLLEVMRNQPVLVIAGQHQREVTVTEAGTCRNQGAPPTLVTLRPSCMPGEVLNALDGDCDGQVDEGSTWSMTTTMSSPRFRHTATVLDNGQVLVAGGYASGGGSPPLGSSEMFDPVTHTWSVVTSMVTARTQHSATLLMDGRVLVAGGESRNGSLASAEVFDPVTRNWSSTGSMIQARHDHTATLLKDGRVLVVGGGGSSGSLITAEVYDPHTGTWSTIASMTSARNGHIAELLNNGQVLAAGGANDGVFLDTAEVYDPATNRWSVVGSMAQPRGVHAAVLLKNGRVLVSGGEHKGSYLSTAEVYDPATGLWSPVSSMSMAHTNHTMVLLPSGQALVSGGYGAGLTAEVYNPNTQSWSSTRSMNQARAELAAVPLHNGQILVTGGWGAGNTAEIYIP
ncbi:Kelch repeat-containing protein [Archangium violaceum]|uniref:Kelch repeat-containing protein n=1 Tax=Archangium violaceum TaxID=83451 RepID=UPI0036DB8B64